MTRTTAKICGLSTAETLDAAIGGRASHVGFVFFPPSPRDLSPEQAASLIARAPPRIGKVGVFVDPDDALIERTVAAGIDIIQLHGDESPDRAAALRARTGLEIWKAIPVRTRADLDGVRAFRGAATRILYDAKPPKGAAMPGGLGMRFDWKLLESFVHPLPWILSGGLDPANVGDAIATTGAPLVDVSSGVESGPGVKDVDKIRLFLQAVAQS